MSEKNIVKCEDKDTHETFTKHLIEKEILMLNAMKCDFTAKMLCKRCGEMVSMTDIINSIPDTDRTKKILLMLVKRGLKFIF